ncbi:TPA: hypothetical protein ACXDAZ_002236 [Clostridium botulinum]|uniref:hypothetical protein n=1 Tax=Clostridium botulinum TaxID=1491 RepID=UPI0008FCCE7F|nr:hypothetical protein [Clostridium botulinum]APC81638.1 hypothetical protein NPD2_1032 [Clostridium botulinum]MCS4448641.1 hypothetical protein [Clostridium botulinum]MCS4459062.1 hypothetical protein [Clostridium botulinum]MCS4462449.1 hypothetical protein [Clostridium botulinum]MCS4512227.1 hypothetical protein [Clostridium botulinum]
MKLEQLKYQSETDDITFNYKDKEYVICLLKDKYCAGEAEKEDDNVFNSFDDMANKWIIQGNKLKDIVEKIEVI